MAHLDHFCRAESSPKLTVLPLHSSIYYKQKEKACSPINPNFSSQDMIVESTAEGNTF